MDPPLFGRLRCWLGWHRYTVKGVPGVYVLVCERCHKIQ